MFIKAIFNQKYSKNNNIVKYYYKQLFSIFIYIFKFNYSCKAKFSASLLLSSVTKDPSEIILICWFAAQESFLVSIDLKKKLCC